MRFGAGNLALDKGWLLLTLEDSTSQVNDVIWYPDVNAVGTHLEMQPLATVD